MILYSFNEIDLVYHKCVSSKLADSLSGSADPYMDTSPHMDAVDSGDTVSKTPPWVFPTLDNVLDKCWNTGASADNHSDHGSNPDASDRSSKSRRSPAVSADRIRLILLLPWVELGISHGEPFRDWMTSRMFDWWLAFSFSCRVPVWSRLDLPEITFQSVGFQTSKCQTESAMSRHTFLKTLIWICFFPLSVALADRSMSGSWPVPSREIFL